MGFEFSGRERKVSFFPLRQKTASKKKTESEKEKEKKFEKKLFTFVVRVGLEVAPVLDVVKVLDAVLLGHVAEDVDVAVGAGVRGEDVVVLEIFFIFF
jgi:hypothetical protein